MAERRPHKDELQVAQPNEVCAASGAREYLDVLPDDNVLYAIRRVDDEDATESLPDRNAYRERLPDDDVSLQVKF